MNIIFKEIKDLYPNWDPALEGKIKTKKEDLDKIINTFNCKYPESFIIFQLEDCYEIPMGDFDWDGFGWANNSLDPYMNLYSIVECAREIGVPEYLSPFRDENGDYYCFDSRKENYPVVVWDHNTRNIEEDPNYQWNDFIQWLKDGFDRSY